MSKPMSLFDAIVTEAMQAADDWRLVFHPSDKWVARFFLLTSDGDQVLDVTARHSDNGGYTMSSRYFEDDLDAVEFYDNDMGMLLLDVGQRVKRAISDYTRDDYQDSEADEGDEEAKKQRRRFWMRKLALRASPPGVDRKEWLNNMRIQWEHLRSDDDGSVYEVLYRELTRGLEVGDLFEKRGSVLRWIGDGDGHVDSIINGFSARSVSVTRIGPNLMLKFKDVEEEEEDEDDEEEKQRKKRAKKQ